MHYLCRIRHAVAIDERRAKFRQDLIGEVRPVKENHYRQRHHWWDMGNQADLTKEGNTRGRASTTNHVQEHHDTLEIPDRWRNPSETTGVRSLSPGMTIEDDRRSIDTSGSGDSRNMLEKHYGEEGADDSDDDEQDIKEVWFPGCHADIGGGWPLSPGEDTALAHVPLVWLVREAERAGLKFDPKKVRDLNCAEELYEIRRKTGVPIPEIEVESPPLSPPINGTNDLMAPAAGNGSSTELVDGEPMPTVGAPASHPPPTIPEDEQSRVSRFHRALENAGTKGRMHDVLQFNNGAAVTGVIAWNFMEYLPFRRMDLQPDGSWKSISWPLPKGEVRDIPDNVVIHHSVLKRMEADPKYRPGNLIIGGGGRGTRVAPKEYGLGRWKVHREEGDPVGEVWIRDGKPGLLEEEEDGAGGH